ncbi:uncharacterized protein ACRADG_001606 [Cochliomyia hominivorax]
MNKIHHHNHLAVKLKVVKVFLLIILYSSLLPTCLLKTKALRHGKRFIIHVPMKIRTHHHTHTVYTHVHNKGKDSGNAEKASKQTIYKIMGYSTHHTGLSAGAAGPGGVGGNKLLGPGRHHRHHAHNYRLNRGNSGGGFGSGYGEINYDDYSNCDNCLPQGNGAGLGGDLIFNHFSRHDEDDYPDLEEEVIDDEEGDEWE